ncbi:hypothetical protein CMO88_00650 [Candidatus Woesearchaeota archaeon]|nr:hypothetical protein [Candidatus Woesearchaeota archaeon]|tara:strand:- start:7838 stop:8212 length:375 start_codon:yes stop_codon:yes gene_type:complete
MVNKKGMFKTLEALIAIFMTMTVLIVFIQQGPEDQTNEPKGFLSILREDESFRSCVLTKNTTCINDTIDKNLEENFEFLFNLSESSSASVSDLPDVQIFSEAVFLTGNVTNSTNTIVRVFYWNK